MSSAPASDVPGPATPAPVGPGPATPAPTDGAGPVPARSMRAGLRHLPTGLAAAAVVALVGAVVAFAVAGGAAAAGVAAGVALVAASYVISSVVVVWADGIDPKLVLPAGLGSYAVKFTVLFFVMAAIVDTGWAGTFPMAIGVIAGVVGWTAAHLWWTLRSRNPYLDLPPGGNRPDDDEH